MSSQQPKHSTICQWPLPGSLLKSIAPFAICQLGAIHKWFHALRGEGVILFVTKRDRRAEEGVDTNVKSQLDVDKLYKWESVTFINGIWLVFGMCSQAFYLCKGAHDRFHVYVRFVADSIILFKLFTSQVYYYVSLFWYYSINWLEQDPKSVHRIKWSYRISEYYLVKMKPS